MFKVYLVPIEEAAYIFLLLGIGLLIPICVVHYRRFGYLRFDRALVFYSFLFYGLCAIFLVILPLPEITTNFCQVHSLASQVQLIPLQFIRDTVTRNQISLRHFNLISILESSVFLQAFFNFLLLMPLGFYLHYYFKTSFRLALLIAIATTATFEMTQLTGIYGIYPCPYRYFDVDDLILNTSGAVVGYLIMPLFQFLPNLQHQPEKIPQKVSPMRRLVAFVIDWFLANTLAQGISSLLFGDWEGKYKAGIYFLVYFAYFIIVPWLWQGQTPGKKLVFIHLVRANGKSVKFLTLCLRYGLLVYFPVITDLFFHYLFERQLEQLGYVDGVSGIIFLSLITIEFLCLFTSMLIRSDRLAVHDLVSKTQNAIAR
ncbi:VanZ family protein [Pleurocapsa sp. PCC 7319]|uniref:VanZ family protein n=1 Tax=Pleurocapsa sp. PCC 7319 TaxID=118161 RepID=UPI000372E995|nr:VanZ family protein [Pleurocapsa sp. PCC 7319]